MQGWCAEQACALQSPLHSRPSDHLLTMLMMIMRVFFFKLITLTVVVLLEDENDVTTIICH